MRGTQSGRGVTPVPAAGACCWCLQVCQAVMSIREHKDRGIIRLSVIELLPRLAQFCPDMFAR